MSTIKKKSAQETVLQAKRRAAYGSLTRNLFGSVQPFTARKRAWARSYIRRGYGRYRRPFGRPLFNRRKLSTSTLTSVGHDGEVKFPFVVPVGSGSIEREFDEIHMTSMYLKGMAVIQKADAYSGLYAFLWVVVDKKPKGEPIIKLNQIFNVSDRDPCTAMVLDHLADRFKVIHYSNY